MQTKNEIHKNDECLKLIAFNFHLTARFLRQKVKRRAEFELKQVKKMILICLKMLCVSILRALSD